MRKRQNNLASELGVLTVLHPLNCVPQVTAPLQEGGASRWRKDSRIHDTFPPRVVVDDIVLLIFDALAGSVSCRCYRRSAV
jgi:hypothetical protein